MEKRCNKCKEIKSISEFYKGKNKCKNCDRINAANYYRENAEKIKNARNERHRKNPEISKADNLKWRKNNSDEHKEYCRKWVEANRERSASIKRKYSKTLKGKEAINKRVRKRRAIRAEALHHEHSFVVESVLEKMRQRLTNCLKIDFDLDHILPISQGGPHHHGNLQVIPSILNIMKGNRLNYTHPILTHWTEIPDVLINWKNNKKIKLNK